MRDLALYAGVLPPVNSELELRIVNAVMLAANRGCLIDFSNVFLDGNSPTTDGDWQILVDKGHGTLALTCAMLVASLDAHVHGNVADLIQDCVFKPEVFAALFGKSQDGNITRNHPPSSQSDGNLDRAKAQAICAYVGTIYAQDRERAKKVAKDILEPLVTQAKQECRDREFLDALRAASQTTDLAFKIGRSFFEAAMSAPQPFQIADPSKDKHFHDNELPPLPDSTSAEHEYAQPATNSAPLDPSAPVAVSASGLLPASDIQTSVADNQSPVSVTQDSASAASSSADLSTPAPAPRSPSPAFLPSTSYLAEHPQFVRPGNSSGSDSALPRQAPKRKAEDDGSKLNDDGPQRGGYGAGANEGKGKGARTRQERARAHAG
ncbi:hypothetical protein EV715DRAFT_267647 [Schizophyllum commune]